jgi:UDP-N-acetylmuramoylalanine--D-glutamate ligase
MDTESIALEGKHNMKKCNGSNLCSKIDANCKAIRESLSSFQGVEHRLEKVLKIQNVQYINDSKATNVNATFFLHLTV